MSRIRRTVSVAAFLTAGLGLVALWTLTLVGIIEGVSLVGRMVGVGFLLAATAMFVAALVAAAGRTPRDWDRGLSRELTRDRD